MRPAAVRIGIAVAGLAALALAGTTADSRERRSTSTPPRVTATHPSQGEVIEPGPYTLSVTFDREMEDETYSYVETSEGVFPECDVAPRLSPDRRTFLLRCMARAGKQQAVWFNRDRYMNFRSAADGQSAVPFKLYFSVRPLPDGRSSTVAE